MMKWKIIPLRQLRRKNNIRSSAEAVNENLHAGNISRAAALTAMPVLIHGAVYMRIFIFPVGNRRNYGERIRSIRNFEKKFCMLFLCDSKNKPPAMQGEGRSLDISNLLC